MDIRIRTEKKVRKKKCLLWKNIYIKKNIKQNYKNIVAKFAAEN